MESVDTEMSAFRRVGLCKVEYSDAGDTKEYAKPADHWKSAYEEIGKEEWSLMDIKMV